MYARRITKKANYKNIIPDKIFILPIKDRDVMNQRLLMNKVKVLIKLKIKMK